MARLDVPELRLPQHDRQERACEYYLSRPDGKRTEDIPSDLRANVLARYPRLGLGEEFVGYFETQAQRKPLCLAAKCVRSGWAARVAANPLEREARRGRL